MDKDKKRGRDLKVRETGIIPTSGKVLMGLEQAREVARLMWEVQGLTMPQIAETMGKSLSAIEKWSRVCHWKSKKELLAAPSEGRVKVQENTRQKFLDLLAERGMPQEKAIDLLIEGMTAPELEPVVVSAGTDGEGNPLPDQVIRRKDYKTTHKHLHDYMLIAGVVGNNQEKQQGVAGNGLANVNIQINIPDKAEL